MIFMQAVGHFGVFPFWSCFKLEKPALEVVIFLAQRHVEIYQNPKRFSHGDVLATLLNVLEPLPLSSRKCERMISFDAALSTRRTSPAANHQKHLLLCSRRLCICPIHKMLEHTRHTFETMPSYHLV